MNFEELLDRLVERHEALTLSVELIAHLQLDYEKRNQIQIEKNQILMTQVLESINRVRAPWFALPRCRLPG